MWDYFIGDAIIWGTYYTNEIKLSFYADFGGSSASASFKFFQHRNIIFKIYLMYTRIAITGIYFITT